MKLKRDLQKSRRSAYARGTRKNLYVQWKSFVLFCLYFKFTVCPAQLDTLCMYAQFLSRSFKSVESIRNYLSGIKLMHLLTGFTCPDLSAIDLTLALRGLMRNNPHCPKQALPITPDILLLFLQNLDLSDPSHLAHWCLFLFAFFLMLRKSNLVPESIKAMDLSKILCRGDVAVLSKSLLVHIKWSKTIQFGQRTLTLPLVSIPGSPLCPVQAFKQMSACIPASASDPAFVVPGKKKVIPITYRKLQSFLKEMIRLTGKDPDLYSSHSFRRGGATWAFRSHVPGELIQLHGDWASDAYKKYLHFPLASRMLVVSKMGSLIKKL